MDLHNERPTIAIIGAGRVGSSLGHALHAAGYQIIAVASRTPAHADELAAEVGAARLPLLAACRSAELVLMVVPDDAIRRLARLVANARGWRQGQMVVHVSGALPAAALQPAASRGALIGSFHPLAAFAERNLPLPPGLTFGIEATGVLRDLLGRIASDLGGRALDLAPADKPLYHAAAVLASNYTVVLAALAAQLLGATGVTADDALAALLPLLETTLDNLRREGLPAALTGPLVRGDAGTVIAHLGALQALDPVLAAVYRTLGQAALPFVAERHSGETLDRLQRSLQTGLVVKEEQI